MTYEEYHKAVVDRIVALTDEKNRQFFDSMDYSEEFKNPDDWDDIDGVAQGVVDATDWEAAGPEGERG